ncbi:MAG TPA: HAMP domain-containing histidine kinase, partial [Candidatus Hydrogenedentes bacterium]|nr:HAMP domain-containing histidine kinase [Candidatus Hydrogenedentota bacterium]
LTLLNTMVRGSTRHFRAEYGEDLPPLRGDYQRLEQVVINLVQNACQALPDPEAAITLSTRYDAEENAVVLEVADEGCGIPSESLPHVTDPFFTTKRASGGTGLGLSIASSIVMEHGGRMTFDSAPGKGTRVSVTLPLDRGEG